MAPIAKRRKTEQIAELNFDPTARQDYLTGFRKRKLQRISQAQDVAKRREREEKIEGRKQLREQRKEDLEKHLADVDAVLKRQASDAEEVAAEAAGTGSSVVVEEEWAGIEKPATLDGTDEYVDEDKYTTVTIQDMGEPETWNESEDDEQSQVTKNDGSARTTEKDKDGTQTKKKRIWHKGKPDGGTAKPSRKKTQKFRYESKAERQKGRQKQKAKNTAAAKKRRGD